MIIDQDHLSRGGSCLTLLSIMLGTFCTNMAAGFALAVVQDTLEHLDSYQDGDYSGILFRLEYLNRIIINFGIYSILSWLKQKIITGLHRLRY